MIESANRASSLVLAHKLRKYVPLKQQIDPLSSEQFHFNSNFMHLPFAKGFEPTYA